jgi:hypothetical protein
MPSLLVIKTNHLTLQWMNRCLFWAPIGILYSDKESRDKCPNSYLQWLFYVWLTVHPNIIIVNYQPGAHFLYFVQYVGYIPLHVSSNMLLIIRRIYCINTASGTVLSSSLNLCTDQPLRVQTVTIPDACCINTICPPDDEHIVLDTCRGM